MLNQNEQIKQHTQKALETSKQLLQHSIEGFEKLTAQQLEATKFAIDHATTNIKAVCSTKNPKDMITAASEFATSAFEKNIENCRNICGVLSTSQTKFNQILEAQFQGYSKYASFFTPQSNVFNWGTTVESIIDATNQTIGNINKCTNDMTHFTNTCLSSASETLESIFNTTKNAAAEVVTTTQNATNLAVTNAKKVATEAVANVINLTKKSSGQIVAKANTVPNIFSQTKKSTKK